MKIISIRCVGLVGETPKGGWSVELKPEDSVHTLVAVHTDAGVTGYGSVFTNHLLVEAALRVLEPLYRGEHPLEPEASQPTGDVQGGSPETASTP